MMTAMAKELQLSVLRISRLFAVAEAVGGGLGGGGKMQDLTPHCRDPVTAGGGSGARGKT